MPEERYPDSEAGPTAGSGGLGSSDAPGPETTHSASLQEATGPASLSQDLLAGTVLGTGIPLRLPTLVPYPTRIPTWYHPPARSTNRWSRRAVQSFLEVCRRT